MTIRPLPSLHRREFEHPFDAKALDALEGTPGLDTLARQFVKHGIERLYRIQYTGSNLQITDRNYPDLYRVLIQACEILGVEKIPRMYVEAGDEINALATGVEDPIVVLSAGCIDKLSPSELTFVLGHELGHIKSAHVVYHLMGSSLGIMGQLIDGFTLHLGKLLTVPVQAALSHWSKMSELTADRAGLLSCQDLDAAISVMIRIAGLPTTLAPHHQEFVRQAKDFDDLDYAFASKWMKFAVQSDNTHPWTVIRAAELLKWHESGDYDAVINRTTKDREHKKRIDGQAFCRVCSYRLEGNEAFCPHCGTALETPVV